MKTLSFEFSHVTWTSNTSAQFTNSRDIKTQTKMAQRAPCSHCWCSARLGGDEFVILLSERQEENNAFVIIERIRKQISNTVFDSGTYKFNASCSFGIVTLEPEQLTITDLANQMLSCADEALYNAKHEGKNKIGVATLPQLEL